MTPEEAFEPFSVSDPYPFEDFGDAIPGPRTQQKLSLVRFDPRHDSAVMLSRLP